MVMHLKIIMKKMCLNVITVYTLLDLGKIKVKP